MRFALAVLLLAVAATCVCAEDPADADAASCPPLPPPPGYDDLPPPDAGPGAGPDDPGPADGPAAGEQFPTGPSWHWEETLVAVTGPPLGKNFVTMWYLVIAVPGDSPTGWVWIRIGPFQFP